MECVQPTRQHTDEADRPASKPVSLSARMELWYCAEILSQLERERESVFIVAPSCSALLVQFQSGEVETFSYFPLSIRQNNYLLHQQLRHRTPDPINHSWLVFPATCCAYLPTDHSTNNKEEARCHPFSVPAIRHLGMCVIGWSFQRCSADPPYRVFATVVHEGHSDIMISL